MKRRIIAASAAILIAVVSAVLLLGYVAGADRRAMAGMRTAQVLVVAESVPEGTAADQLTDLVAERELPTTAIVDGAVSELSQIAGLVANADLQPGEQLLASRFSDPATADEEREVKIPAGFSEVSFQLEPQRVVGSDLAVGDTVGVFLSVGDNADTGRTHLSLDKVLVTRIQGVTAAQAAEQAAGDQNAAETTSEAKQDKNSAAPVPEGSLMVTVALSANDAEQLVFTSEYGRIWLSKENTDSTDQDTRIVTGKNVQQ